MRHAGPISNQRSRAPPDPAAILRAAAAPNLPVAGAGSIVGAARNSAASVPWHRAQSEKWVLQARALDPIQRVFVIARNHVGRGTPGAVVGVGLVVAAPAQAVERKLDRASETVV